MNKLIPQKFLREFQKLKSRAGLIIEIIFCEMHCMGSRPLAPFFRFQPSPTSELQNPVRFLSGPNVHFSDLGPDFSLRAVTHPAESAARADKTQPT